jgi:hypothetical protein
MARADFYTLPADLPVPVDDGAALHLPGRRLPALALPSTAGRQVQLDALGSGWTVLYYYPRTGHVQMSPAPPDWDAPFGARGCTPQACGYRDHHASSAPGGPGIRAQHAADGVSAGNGPAAASSLRKYSAIPSSANQRIPDPPRWPI